MYRATRHGSARPCGLPVAAHLEKGGGVCDLAFTTRQARGYTSNEIHGLYPRQKGTDFHAMCFNSQFLGARSERVDASLGTGQEIAVVAKLAKSYGTTAIPKVLATSATSQSDSY